jgi:hypothetical protein
MKRVGRPEEVAVVIAIFASGTYIDVNWGIDKSSTQLETCGATLQS